MAGVRHSGQAWGEALFARQRGLVELPQQIGTHGHGQALEPGEEAVGDWEMSKARESWGHWGKETEKEEHCRGVPKAPGQRHH